VPVVAGRFGVDVETVCRHVHEAGVARRGKLVRLDVASIAHRYQAGARGVPEVGQGLDQRVRGGGGHMLAPFPVGPRV
jgi:hypothetical protein